MILFACHPPGAERRGLVAYRALVRFVGRFTTVALLTVGLRLQAADSGAADGATSAAIPAAAPLAWGPGTVPQNFSLKRWDRDDGLPQDSVQALMQARDGAIWVGTNEGAARYDGQVFTRISRATTKGFPTASVSCLLEAADGAIWMGTDDAGIVLFKDGKVERITRAEGLRSKTIRALAQDADGFIWIATASGLNRYKDGVITTVPDETALEAQTVNALFRNPEGSVLAAANSLCALRGDSITREPIDVDLNSNRFRLAYVGPAGARWVVTTSEVARLDGPKRGRFTIGNGVRPSTVHGLAEDRDGNLWLATTAGLLRFDGRHFAPQPVQGLDPNETVQAILPDREGNVWIGTNAGLRMLRRTAFTAFGAPEGLRAPVVTSLIQDAAGVLWVGTTGQGLARIDGRGITYLRQADGLPSNNVRSLAVVPDGGLLVGFDKPFIVRVHDGRVEPVKNVPETVQSGIEVLYQDRRGGIWAGTRLGLWRFSDGPVQTFSAGEYNHVRATAICEDPQGRVWVGTNHGLIRWAEGKCEVWRIEQGLPHDNIRALHYDADGVLWLGTTANGLDWFKDGVFHHCSAKQGLPSEAILALADDDAGRLWVCTPMGLSWAQKTELGELARGERKKVSFVTYTKSDGLRGTEVSTVGTPVARRFADGRLWFALTKTVAAVDPGHLPRNDTPPSVAITSVRLDGTAVPRKPGIVVPAGVSQVEIGYTALSFAQPERIRFRYKLSPLNRRWVDAGDRRVALLNDVPPGRWTFHVQAMNNDGVWSETDAELKFEFAPYFYQTRWFYVTVAVAAAALIVAIHRLRLRSLRQRERELVRVVEERTAHLEAQIAERRRAQEALTRSEALYESLVQVLPLDLYRKERDGRFTFGNQHFCRQVGRAPAEIVGKTDAEIHPSDVARKTRAADEQVMSTGEIMEAEELDTATEPPRWLHTLKVPVRDAAGAVVGVQGLAWDITPRKRAEEDAARAHRELVQLSRVAGMAEVATNVLHNVGNVLNSVNVSASIAIERVRASKGPTLGRVAELLETHAGDLATFVAADPRAKALPGYLRSLAENLATDQSTLIAELELLRKHVNDINDIIAMQQRPLPTASLTEAIPLEQVIADARGMCASPLTDKVPVECDITQPVTTCTDRHKVLQILVHLLDNAKHACTEAGGDDRRIVVRLEQEGLTARIRVRDNGMGIPAENLTRIFAHGFTTRKNGHGFGLHSAALLARELGGQLRAESDGPGRGAELVLELPVRAAAG